MNLEIFFSEDVFTASRKARISLSLNTVEIQTPSESLKMNFSRDWIHHNLEDRGYLFAERFSFSLFFAVLLNLEHQS